MAAKAERLGLLSTLVTFLLAGLVYGFARWSGGAATLVTSGYLAIAVLIAVVSYFHLRLARRVLDEHLEEQDLTGEEGESIFTAPTEENVEAFTAEHALRQFERYIIPGFTILLAALHLAFGFILMRRMKDLAGLPAEKYTAVAALLASVAFVLYVGGRILAAMAEEKDYRLLLAPAGYLLLCATVSLLGGVAAGSAHFKIPLGDTIAAWIGIGAMGFLGVEYLITAVLEIYRPRTGGEARPLYESRLCELLARPRGLFQSIAQTVDYQFGFKVSETWFYHLLEQAVLPLILVQVLSLYLLSCFAFLGPAEEGIHERFGKPVSHDSLQPGIHLKLPWPIDRVVKYPAKEALEVEIGHGAGGEEESDHADDPVILWTTSHGDQDAWLMASRGVETVNDDHDNATDEHDHSQPSDDTAAPTPDATVEAVPVNLVNLHAVVQYRITDVYRYHYGFANAQKILSDIAHRVAVKKLVSADLFDLMGAHRLDIAEDLRGTLQKTADELKLGVSIDFVGIENVHPPVQVAPAFEGVVGASEEAETEILQAEAYHNKEVPKAKEQQAKLLAEAEGYRIRRQQVAEAEAYAFAKQRRAYRLGGKVYLYRSYLDGLERALESNRKYILTNRNTHDVTVLNLEDKLRPGLLDAGVAATESNESEE